MSDPVVLSVQLESNGDIQVHWTRPGEHSEVDATYYTTLISREGQDSDEQLTYWANELRQDVTEFMWAYLKVKNRG